MREAKPPFERRWSERRLPLKWLTPSSIHRIGNAAPGDSPLDLSAKINELCKHITVHSPTFSHIDMSQVAVSFVKAKSETRHGLQARLTPMRVEDGRRDVIRNGRSYRVQAYYINDVELKYIVSFCVPRFLDLPPQEKLITIFHELYHIGEKFDGDIRRHDGRCQVHTGSKKNYDRRMAELAEDYYDRHPNPNDLAWLALHSGQLWQRHQGVYGIVLPVPKLIAVPMRVTSVRVVDEPPLMLPSTAPV